MLHISLGTPCSLFYNKICQKKKAEKRDKKTTTGGHKYGPDIFNLCSFSQPSPHELFPHSICFFIYKKKKKQQQHITVLQLSFWNLKCFFVVFVCILFVLATVPLNVNKASFTQPFREIHGKCVPWFVAYGFAWLNDNTVCLWIDRRKEK